MSTRIADANESELTILARVLGIDNGPKKLTKELARHLLSLGFDEKDKARMHELAERNQADALSAAEKKELLAYGKVGDMLSILKSKARRRLNTRARRRTHS